MKVLSWEEFSRGFNLEKPLAATVGVFDGLHIGHRELIGRVFLHGASRTKTVFTFRENPKLVLRPSSFHGSLSSLDQKLEGLEALGLDLCVLIDFSGNFSKLAGKQFLSILRERGRLEYIAVGANFSCGYKLDTHAADIADFYAGLGIRAEVLDPVLWEGHPVSSSRIRMALIEGRLADAAAMFGRNYEIDLRGIEGRGGDDGSLVLARPRGIVLPPEGEYEAEARGKGGRTQVRLGVHREALEISPGGGQRPDAIAVTMLAKETKRYKE